MLHFKVIEMETGLAERSPEQLEKMTKEEDKLICSYSALKESVGAQDEAISQQRTDFRMLEDVMYSQRVMIGRLKERTDELEAQVGSVKKMTKIMAVMLFGVGCVMLAFLLHVAGMI